MYAELQEQEAQAQEGRGGELPGLRLRQQQGLAPVPRRALENKRER